METGQQVSEIAVNDGILEVKFTFDGQVVPKIYEILVTKKLNRLLNKDLLLF